MTHMSNVGRLSEARIIHIDASRCNSFRSVGRLAWNSLPGALREASLTNSMFKSKLKTHLFPTLPG